MTKPPFAVIAGIIALAAQAAVLTAADITWTGANSNLYSDEGNWSSRLPRNNSYSDIVVFGGGGAGLVILEQLPFDWDAVGSPSHSGINFTSAGWTISNSGGVSYNNLTKLQSSGEGTNTIASSFNLNASSTWVVGTGNTLNLANGFYQRNYSLTLEGGGTLEVGGSIGGFSSGSWGIHITDALLLVNSNLAYSSTTPGQVFINGLNARLQLETTVANVEAQILSGDIVDELGMGLQVTDLGNGYVEVSAIPEPGTGVFFLLAGTAAMLLVRRGRQRVR